MCTEIGLKAQVDITSHLSKHVILVLNKEMFWISGSPPDPFTELVPSVSSQISPSPPQLSILIIETL